MDVKGIVEREPRRHGRHVALGGRQPEYLSSRGTTGGSFDSSGPNRGNRRGRHGEEVIGCAVNSVRLGGKIDSGFGAGFRVRRFLTTGLLTTGFVTLVTGRPPNAGFALPMPCWLIRDTAALSREVREVTVFSLTSLVDGPRCRGIREHVTVPLVVVSDGSGLVRDDGLTVVVEVGFTEEVMRLFFESDCATADFGSGTTGLTDKGRVFRLCVLEDGPGSERTLLVIGRAQESSLFPTR